MQIDWFTAAAQIVNFLILVWLLQRFLYAPVIRAMDRREERVAERLREADRRRAEAEREATRHREERAALDAKRQELLREAREEARAQGEELLEEARREVEAQRRRWLRELERERESFAREVRSLAAEWTLRALRRALSELADASLEAQMLEVFAERLRKLGGKERETLARAVGEGSIRVVTGFPLSQEQRERIRRALAESLGESGDRERRTPPEVEFAEATELLAGIELRGAGHRLGWSLDTWLGDLQARLEEALRKPQEPAESSGG